MENSEKLSTSLTDSKFTGWGWSMIIYALLMYFFFALIGTDGQNLFPRAFAGVYGHDSNVLLGYATPAGIVGGFLFARLLMKKSVRNLSALALIITGIAVIIVDIVGAILLFLIRTKKKHEVQ